MDQLAPDHFVTSIQHRTPAFAHAGPRGRFLVGRDLAALRAAKRSVHAINPIIQTLAVVTDISSAAAVTALFATIATTFDGSAATILINNADFLSGDSAAPMHAQDPHAGVSTSSQPRLGAAWLVYSFLSGYSLSKLAGLQLMNFVATAYPQVTAVALHPGLVDTDMFDEAFRSFDLDSPALVSGVTVWLAAGSERANVEDLGERKEEIVTGELLKMKLNGKLGKDQFSEESTWTR
ncbi:short-chain dehydrogenase reductase [Podospora aff. communis PSN243]|uniref:Short-chain dehydrogenase reductase n=1 Tax=Podospora aff. communis PSN243 TaxID=3040156 RepID=A0AAV9GQQ8_9PEZI|nr:short-chain dehydrogenase reductase [Podospora aff. communis PSN243]